MLIRRGDSRPSPRPGSRTSLPISRSTSSTVKVERGLSAPKNGISFASSRLF